MKAKVLGRLSSKLLYGIGVQLGAIYARLGSRGGR